MTLCLVTDRARLAAPGAPLEHAIDCLTRQVRQAVEAGIELVQVRERDLDGGPLAALVARCVAIAKGSATTIVVNDRLDVAVACGAGGVHLRGDSMAPGDARRLAPPGFLVGRSVHAADEAAKTSGADYLIAGTVFSTASKPAETRTLGVDGLRAVVRAARVPVLAIGGVDEGRIPDVAAAGAAGVAAIGLFLGPPRGGESAPCGAAALHDIVARVRERFDSVKTAP